MAKKVLITEEQKSLLSKLSTPIDADTFEPYIPLNDEKLSAKLLQDAIKDCVSAFNYDITQVPQNRVFNKITALFKECTEKEEKIRPQLEQICYNTIVTLFNIPENTVEIELELVDSIAPDRKFKIVPNSPVNNIYDSVDEMDAEKEDFEKRFLVNMMIEGISDDLTSTSKKQWIGEVSEIDEELPLLYSKIIKLNRYAIFTMDVDDINDRNNMQGGFVEAHLDSNGKPLKITVNATCFPILLHEAIKGILELSAAHSLPESLDAAKKVIDNCDVLKQEPWNMRFGKEVWNRIKGDEEIESELIPVFLDQLSSLDSNSFIALIKELLYNTRKGRVEIEKLLNYVNGYYDSRGGEERMLKKDTEKQIIDEIRAARS